MSGDDYFSDEAREKAGELVDKVGKPGCIVVGGTPDDRDHARLLLDELGNVGVVYARFLLGRFLIYTTDVSATKTAMDRVGWGAELFDEAIRPRTRAELQSILDSCGE